MLTRTPAQHHNVSAQHGGRKSLPVTPATPSSVHGHYSREQLFHSKHNTVLP